MVFVLLCRCCGFSVKIKLPFELPFCESHAHGVKLTKNRIAYSVESTGSVDLLSPVPGEVADFIDTVN